MKTQTTGYQPNFQAKYFFSQSLKKATKHAAAKGKYDKLDRAIKNLENCSTDLRKRIFVDIGKLKDNRPYINFEVFVPKYYITNPKTIEDYNVYNGVKYISSKKCNPFDYAIRKLIEIGRNAPENDLYQKVLRRINLE